MLEKIYTIPLNEKFDESRDDHSRGCPFCRLYDKIEDEQLDHILGEAMMEPSVRIVTNEKGFCRRHYDMMLTRKNRLGLALMMESHMIELREKIDTGAVTELILGKGKKATSNIRELSESCYICDRIEDIMEHMFANAALLWETEKEFRQKTSQQPGFCLTHYARFIEAARGNMKKKAFAEFASDIKKTELAAFDELKGDISHFCRKFDYRYENEPWGNAKDAPDRAAKFLS